MKGSEEVCGPSHLGPRPVHFLWLLVTVLFIAKIVEGNEKCFCEVRK